MEEQRPIGYPPLEGHPERVDPAWVQERLRLAFERCVRDLMAIGAERDEAYERAMWHVLMLRESPLFDPGAASGGEAA